MRLKNFDVSAAIREASRVRLPKIHPHLSRTGCRVLVRERVRLVGGLGAHAGATTEFNWIRKRCSGCGRCAVPPA